MASACSTLDCSSRVRFVGVGGKSEVRNRARFGSWCRTQATTRGGHFAERSFPSYHIVT